MTSFPSSLRTSRAKGYPASLKAYSLPRWNWSAVPFPVPLNLNSGSAPSWYCVLSQAIFSAAAFPPVNNSPMVRYTSRPSIFSIW